MKKNYVLRLNDGYWFFRSIEGVKERLKEFGVEEVLLDEDDDVVYSLDNLEELEGLILSVKNECLLEMGDDYCEFYLGEIKFED